MNDRKIFPSLVFCYHRILPNQIALAKRTNSFLYVNPENFEKHIQWMMSLGDIVDDIAGLYESASAKPQFMITFDDGWRDNYLYALPILKKYSIGATVFVCSDNVESKRIFWTEEINEMASQSRIRRIDFEKILRNLNYNASRDARIIDKIKIYSHWRRGSPNYLLSRFTELLKVIDASKREKWIEKFSNYIEIKRSNETDQILDWADILIMKKSGIKVGSHTHSHKILDQIGNLEIEQEVLRSKGIIQEKLGSKVTLFSYPNGCYHNSHIFTALKKYQFEYAFTLDNGQVTAKTERLKIPRMLLHEAIGQNIEEHCVNRLKGINTLRRKVFSYISRL
jgi:peptidoglycan/xylan/chitin deacetylase (PgdA/CDA1 family)